MNFCLYAQPFGEASEEFRIITLKYINTSGEKAVTYFKYDNNGRLYQAYWVLDDKSRSSDNLYQYDSNGDLIAAYREFSDGLTSYELFSYDSIGRKISECFYRSDGNTGSATYLYENNKMKKADLRNHKGWLSGMLVCSFNDQGKKDKAVLMKDDDTLCHISYEYDEHKNLIKEHWDFQGRWTQTFHYQYEKKHPVKYYYSSPYLKCKGGNRICKEYYTYNNETGGPSQYDYNEEGLLYRKVFVRSDGISTTTSYEYDQERRLVSSERVYSDSSVAQFEYKYDEDGNLLLRTCFREDTLAGIESYLYNSGGDLIKAYLRNSDNWLTGTISFDHNQLGTITGGMFKGENGFDADILFKYDNDGLLNEIIWNFTFGKFQQYIFEYEIKDFSSS